MEDSYGSGVEDPSSAAAELANARMAEQKKPRRRCDASEASRWATASASACDGRALPRARQAPPPRLPFGGAGLGHTPAQTPPTTEDTHGHPRTLRTRTANPPPSRRRTGAGARRHGVGAKTPLEDRPGHLATSAEFA